MAIFGKQISPARLSALIGNPLTKDGTAAWDHKRKTLSDDHWLVYSAGGVSDDGTEQPCGFWPDRVRVDASGHKTIPDVTGDWRDDAGVPYFCEGSPVLWVAFYPAQDCILQGGRILELQLDDAAG